MLHLHSITHGPLVCSISSLHPQSLVWTRCQYNKQVWLKLTEPDLNATQYLLSFLTLQHTADQHTAHQLAPPLQHPTRRSGPSFPTLLWTPHSHPHLHAQERTCSWRQLPSLRHCRGCGWARPPTLPRITNTQRLTSQRCTGAPLGAPWEVYWISQGCLRYLEAHTYFQTRVFLVGSGRWTNASVGAAEHPPFCRRGLLETSGGNPTTTSTARLGQKSDKYKIPKNFRNISASPRF